MKNVFRRLLLILAIIFITLQFFQPKKNHTPENENSLFLKADVPVRVQAILKNACFDCHSYQTQYPWYDNISPVSWFINGHIIKGKRALNFSKWGQLSALNKISLLDKIGEEAKTKGMPLKSYTLMHKTARLSDEQIKQLADWAEALATEIYKLK
jgi:hypothetical protein